MIISLFQTYVDCMSRLYEREIKDFFEVAKTKMTGTTKEAKAKFGKTFESQGHGISVEYVRTNHSLAVNVCNLVF